LKFGTQMHSGNTSKTAKKNLERGRFTGRVTLRTFGIPYDVYPKPGSEVHSGNISKTRK